jgi:PTS system mannose-specific IIB component/fructoselysine and glucoselysine-specific PTS system IIB component
MPILLFRVDERLIHGQVVLGWGHRLRPERYVVVDEALAESDWEQELYRLSLDAEADAVFVGPGDALHRLDGWRESPVRTVLLTRDLDTMLSLAADGRLAGAEVNLGGIHHAPGRSTVRSYIHLDDADRERIRRLDELGVTVSGRELPDSSRVSLEALLER